jgi:xylan 1,4-beta-xylosidase
MCRLFFAALFSVFLIRATAQRLVLPGDHADPSVVKVGDTYWASATTSNWMPAFPLLASKDLVHWKTVGHVFNTLPSWADYYFWAPELSYDGGKVWVYYSAHKKGGNLCIGIASAYKPEGPYKDHGPVVCQSDGSIDAFPIRDKAGKLFLVWKEDGNSVGKPTPIWMQELNEERTAAIGEKKELFRNSAPWEGALVEGVSILKHGEYYYAFYAAAGCCGSGCTYNTGVARAKSLEGPWEKYSNNPVLKSEGDWKCPGHGTAVEKNGRYYFLYHAYNISGTVYTGREALLKEFWFTPDGWIEFMNDAQPSASVVKERQDNFGGNSFDVEWEWSVFQNVKKRLRNGRLELSAMPQGCGAFVGQKTQTANYTASVEIYNSLSDATPGLALVGDEKNMVAAVVKSGLVQIIQLRDGKETVLDSHPVKNKNKICLQISVRNGKDVVFLLREKKKGVVLNKQPIDGSYLPPWDRALRVGLLAKGRVTEKAVLDNFEIEEQKGN